MYKYMILILMQFVLSQAVVVGQMTPFELLNSYETNQQGLQSHVIKSEDIVEINDTTADHSEWIRSTSEIRRDQGRVDLFIHRWPRMIHEDDPTPPEQASTIRVIWDGQTWLEHEYREKDASGRVVITTRNGEQEKREFVAIGYRGSPLEGIFTGDIEPVVSILRQSNILKLRPGTETVSGTPCHVLEATTPSGTYTIWIDPNLGYNIVKARVHKSGNDILFGKPMMAPYEGSPEISVGCTGEQKPSTVVEFSFALDNIRLEKIGVMWIPIEARYEYVRKFADGRSVLDKVHHKRTHVDLAPDFEAIGAFVTDIPDGTMVWVVEFPGIRYIWQDGKIVPDVDGPTFEEIDKMVDEIK